MLSFPSIIMLGEIRVLVPRQATVSGASYPGGPPSRCVRTATDHRKIFAERDALSNRMIEDISRHMSSAPPTMRASNQIKYDSNSIAKLARAARVLFSAAHN
jgi:hypothetical protein